MIYIRTTITTRIVELLETILADNDYQTNIGYRVRVAMTAGNRHETPCVYLVPGDERSVPDSYGVTLTETDYTVTAVVNRNEIQIAGNTDDPRAEWVIVDALIADVRRCLESRDTELSALTERIVYQGSRVQYHEDGGELCGVELRYTAQFSHLVGDMDTQPS